MKNVATWNGSWAKIKNILSWKKRWKNFLRIICSELSKPKLCGAKCGRLCAIRGPIAAAILFGVDVCGGLNGWPIDIMCGLPWWWRNGGLTGDGLRLWLWWWFDDVVLLLFDTLMLWLLLLLLLLFGLTADLELYWGDGGAEATLWSLAVDSESIAESILIGVVRFFVEKTLDPCVSLKYLLTNGSGYKLARLARVSHWFSHESHKWFYSPRKLFFFIIIKIINVYSNFSSSLYLSFFQFLIKNFSSLSLNQL